MSLYDTGIKMTNGFGIAAQKPADLKFLADTLTDRDQYVTNNLSYEGMIVYVKETKKTYQLIDNIWEEFGFNQEKFEGSIYDGLDSDSNKLALAAKQGKVLNTKISNHEKDTVKHITDEERTKWNAKADTSLATQTNNGLMSSKDKTKLDGIATNANNYTHPDNHPATMITEDSSHRFVTDSQIDEWNAKQSSTDLASQTSDGLMSKEDKKKIDGIADNANNYVHPDNHPANMITQDSTHRFTTDAEKTKWNNVITEVEQLKSQYAEMLNKLKTAVFYD